MIKPLFITNDKLIRLQKLSESCDPKLAPQHRKQALTSRREFKSVDQDESHKSKGNLTAQKNPTGPIKRGDKLTTATVKTTRGDGTLKVRANKTIIAISHRTDIHAAS